MLSITLLFLITLLPQIIAAIGQKTSADESVWPLTRTPAGGLIHRINSAAITIGRYSEKEGDRDMLERTERIRPAVDASDHFGQRPSRQTVSGRWMVEQTVQQQQQPQRLNDQQQTLSRPIRPAQSLPADSGRALPRYDTNLSRFAAAPPSALSSSKNNKMVVPSTVIERIRNGVSLMKPLAKQQQQMHINNAIGTTNGAEQRPKKTVIILTNERMAKSHQMPSEQQMPTHEALTDQKATPLAEFRHEDIRPAVDGERLGPQAKYAGQTNEYREDSGKQFTRKDGPIVAGTAGEYYGPLKYNGGDGLASRMAGKGINPPPEGTRIRMDGWEKSERKLAGGEESKWHGQVSPYLNAPEEITGSRFRNIDEHLNALNGGNRGRGQNRYVKMDLLNE